MKQLLLKTALMSILFSAILCTLGPAVAFSEMRIFELQHRSAGELETIVRAIVSEEARVTAHRNTLVVRSSPAEIAEVSNLVATYDKPLAMLRVTVDQNRVDASHGRGLSASGRVAGDSHSLALQNRARGGDAAIFISTGDAHVSLQGQDIVRHDNRQARHFISVLEGSPAIIRVGRAVPFTSQLRYYSRRHPHFVETVKYQRVDTGFEVYPEIQGDMVRLEIRPYMSFIDQAQPGQIIFNEQVSSINVPIGAWYDLGGYMNTRGGLSREILGAEGQEGSESGRVKIKVDPQ